MITVVLEQKNGNVIATAGRSGNESYLLHQSSNRPLVSMLSEIDYHVFAQEDMGELLRELKDVRLAVEEKYHSEIDEIIDLAERCVRTSGSTLTFTPFEWRRWAGGRGAAGFGRTSRIGWEGDPP